MPFKSLNINHLPYAACFLDSQSVIMALVIIMALLTNLALIY